MTPSPSRRSPSEPRLTRRRFLELLGGVGGTGMVLGTLEAWGMGIASERDAPPALSREAEGTRVVILGAGVAGMAAAYELEKWGYDVVVLEARGFAGGRCQTIRGDSTVSELGGGSTTTTPPPSTTPGSSGCPWRLMVNHNERGWVRFGDVAGPLSGRRLRQGEVKADLRGHVSEILAKSIDRDRLDLELSAADRDRLVAYLVEEVAGAFPPLAGNPVVTSAPDPLIRVVLDGRAGMPAFDDLDAEEIAYILSYIRTTWGNRATLVSPEAVAAVSRERK